MNENTMNNTVNEQKSMSGGQLMLGAFFGVILFVALNRLGLGGAVVGALSGGIGMGLAMLVFRAMQPDDEQTGTDQDKDSKAVTSEAERNDQ